MYERSIKLKSSGRYPGIHLTNDEMRLLEYLFEFKVMPTQNIHFFFNTVAGGKRSGNAITNRLARLVSSGILYQLNDADPKRKVFRAINYAYRLGFRGFELLRERGIISEEEMENSKRYARLNNMPTTHNSVVNTLFMELHKILWERNEDIEPMRSQSFRGERHPLIQSVSKGNRIQPIIPDWIFETEEQIICLELDSGSQAMSVIKNKFARYKLLVRETKKPIVVVFSVGLLTEEEGGDILKKEKRVSSIKELFPESSEWPEGLDLYVVPTQRTSHILYKFLKSRSYRGRLHSRGAANDWLLKSNKVNQPGVSFSVSRNEKLYELFTRSEVDPDLVTEIKKGDLQKYAGVLYMEEGSVRSYERAKVNMKRIYTWNSKLEKKDTKCTLLLVYEEIVNALNDVVALAPLCNTLIVSNEAVRQAIDSKQQIYPKASKLITKYTRNEREVI